MLVNQQRESAGVHAARSDCFAVPDANGWTALHFAAREGEVEMTKALLQHGACTDIRTSKSCDTRYSEVTAEELAARQVNLRHCIPSIETGCNSTENMQSIESA